MQTVIDSEMHGVYKTLASLVIVPVDSVWFPVAGAVDTIRVINKEETELVTPSGPRGATPPAPDALTYGDPQPEPTVGRGW